MEGRLKRGIKWGREYVTNGRIDSRKLQPGDHIFINRALNVYSHHGIYIGNEYVIHYTVVEKSLSKKASTACKKCGYQPSKHCEVLKTCLDCFIYEESLICTDHSLHLYQYGMSKAEYAIKGAGTCCTRDSRPPDEVVRIANDLYENGFGKYHLVFNNCEDFATYCKTGVGNSSQVNFAVVKGVAGLAIGAVAVTVAAIDYFRTRRREKNKKKIKEEETESGEDISQVKYDMKY